MPPLPSILVSPLLLVGVRLVSPAELATDPTSAAELNPQEGTAATSPLQEGEAQLPFPGSFPSTTTTAEDGAAPAPASPESDHVDNRQFLIWIAVRSPC